MTQFVPHSRRLLRLLAVVVTAGTAAAAYALTTAAWARHVAPGGQSGVNRTLSALPQRHLTVMIHDGYLTAQGPAGEVRQAAKLFSSIGDIAVFRGDHETGTGTLAVAVAPPDGEDYVELQTADAGIASVENNYSDTFGVYNASGKLIAAIPGHTTENVSSSGTHRSADAATSTGSSGAVVGNPDLPSGNNFHFTDNLPITLCFNHHIDVISLLDPSDGNTCVDF